MHALTLLLLLVAAVLPFLGSAQLQTPVITAVDCSAAKPCRHLQSVSITGSQFGPAFRLPPNASHVTTVFVHGIACALNTPVVSPTGVSFQLPALPSSVLNTPLPVTVSNNLLLANSTEWQNATSAAFTPGVVSYGDFIVSSVTGCASQSPEGYPVGCVEGDVLTFNGTGFGMGEPGLQNDLAVSLTFWVPGGEVRECTAVTLISNTQFSAAVPAPIPNTPWVTRFQVGGNKTGPGQFWGGVWQFGFPPWTRMGWSYAEQNAPAAVADS